MQINLFDIKYNSIFVLTNKKKRQFYNHGKKKMTNLKEILTANREVIIASIKSKFNISNGIELKSKMIEYVNFCELWFDFEAYNRFPKKSDYMKLYVQRLAKEQLRESNLNEFGTASPKKEKLVDLIGRVNEIEFDNGNCFNQITSKWEPMTNRNQIFH